MNFPKWVAFNDLESWRSRNIPPGPWVVTNGCFDLLHVGHVRYLQRARSLGNRLLVGLNDDEGVRQLKGKNRPLNPSTERAEILAALTCVDAVCVFPGTKATGFLRSARPDVYAKGGDYTLETLDSEERQILQAAGSRIELLDWVADRSTTALVNRMTGT